jgi:hypothetical protein
MANRELRYKYRAPRNLPGDGNLKTDWVNSTEQLLKLAASSLVLVAAVGYPAVAYYISQFGVPLDLLSYRQVLAAGAIPSLVLVIYFALLFVAPRQGESRAYNMVPGVVLSLLAYLFSSATGIISMAFVMTVTIWGSILSGAGGYFLGLFLLGRDPNKPNFRPLDSFIAREFVVFMVYPVALGATATWIGLYVLHVGLDYLHHGEILPVPLITFSAATEAGYLLMVTHNTLLPSVDFIAHNRVVIPPLQRAFAHAARVLGFLVLYATAVGVHTLYLYRDLPRWLGGVVPAQAVLWLDKDTGYSAISAVLKNAKVEHDGNGTKVSDVFVLQTDEKWLVLVGSAQPPGRSIAVSRDRVFAVSWLSTL